MTYNDNGTKRGVMAKVPRRDDRSQRPDVGWYFKAYLDSGDYGMGTLTCRLFAVKMRRQMRYCWTKLSPITPANQPLFGRGGIFERYAGPEYKH